jgi:hypothetical protein
MIIALAWLWQGLVLAGLAFLLLRALPNVNAATRHAMWWAALVAVLCIPLVLLAGGMQDVLPGVPAAPVTDGFAPALVLPAAPTWVGLLCASAWIPEVTSEPTPGLSAAARAPIESRGFFERVDDRLLPAAPAVTMSGLPLRPIPAAAPQQARARSSLERAKGAASTVGSRAERGGLAIGRTFDRARQAIAGKF